MHFEKIEMCKFKKIDPINNVSFKYVELINYSKFISLYIYDFNDFSLLIRIFILDYLY